MWSCVPPKVLCTDDVAVAAHLLEVYIIMKKYLFIGMLLLSAMASSQANASPVRLADKCNIEVRDDNRLTKPLQPTYLDNVITTSSWGSNWFIEAKGGASAFIGTPVGCGDLFDRVMPVLQIGVGKWFTPAVGGRIGYQGVKFKNADLRTMDYQFVHADFMYNLTHNLQCNDEGLSKVDVIPFVGVGMIRNSSSTAGYFLADGQQVGQPTTNREQSSSLELPRCEGGRRSQHPFAFSYGMELRYLLCDRLHLVGEVSGMTTLKNFDCVGTSSRFGDHMLNVSVGLSYTIGKKGWKKVVDARPYINQCNYLLDRNAVLSNYAKEMKKQHHEVTTADKNDYSGLNSLRSRMSQQGDTASDMADTLETASRITIGVPVYFYFQLNTAKLVDDSQLANLDEIARIAKEQHLTVHISGAADSATGTNDRNRALSVERAKYIGHQLMNRGVPKENLKATSLGGISQFTPKEANRFCVVLVQ